VRARLELLLRASKTPKRCQLPSFGWQLTSSRNLLPGAQSAAESSANARPPARPPELQGERVCTKQGICERQVTATAKEGALRAGCCRMRRLTRQSIRTSAAATSSRSACKRRARAWRAVQEACARRLRAGRQAQGCDAEGAAEQASDKAKHGRARQHPQAQHGGGNDTRRRARPRQPATFGGQAAERMQQPQRQGTAAVDVSIRNARQAIPATLTRSTGRREHAPAPAAAGPPASAAEESNRTTEGGTTGTTSGSTGAQARERGTRLSTDSSTTWPGGGHGRRFCCRRARQAGGRKYRRIGTRLTSSGRGGGRGDFEDEPSLVTQRSIAVGCRLE